MTTGLGVDLGSALFIGICAGVFLAMISVDDTEDRRLRRVLPGTLDPWLDGWRGHVLAAVAVTALAWGCQTLAML